MVNDLKHSHSLEFYKYNLEAELFITMNLLNSAKKLVDAGSVKKHIADTATKLRLLKSTDINSSDYRVCIEPVNATGVVINYFKGSTSLEDSLANATDDFKLYNPLLSEKNYVVDIMLYDGLKDFFIPVPTDIISDYLAKL